MVSGRKRAARAAATQTHPSNWGARAVNPALRKNLLTLALLVVCVGGVATHWLPKTVAPYGTMAFVAALLLLMKQAAKWQLFQLPPNSPRWIPQVKARWNLRALVIGILCFPAAIAWVVCVAIGIRLHLLDDVSLTAAWLLLSPSGVLMLLGVFFMAKGIFVGAK